MAELSASGHLLGEIFMVVSELKMVVACDQFHMGRFHEDSFVAVKFASRKGCRIQHSLTRVTLFVGSATD